MANTDIYVAKESFTTILGDAPVTIHKGLTRVRAGHELVRKFASYFEPLTVQYDVEQATAAPGQARAARPQASAPSVEAPAPAAPPASDPKEEAAKAEKE